MTLRKHSTTTINASKCVKCGKSIKFAYVDKRGSLCKECHSKKETIDATNTD